MNSWIAAVINVFKRVTPDHTTLDENSPYHKLIDTAGVHVDKNLTLNNDGPTTVNVFKITGTVVVLHLFSTCTRVGDSTTLSGVKFELDDGTDQSDITAAVNASGAVEGAQIQKTASASGAAEFINPTTGVVTDAGSKILFEPFELTQKTGGVNTFVRLAYTGDANTDVDCHFELHFVPFGHDANVEPA